MLSPDHLTPQTRLFLAMLSHLQQQSPTASPPPPSTVAPTTFPHTDPASNKRQPHPFPSLSDPHPMASEVDTEDPTSAPAPIHIHISTPTTINGSHNRLVLPSPTHLSSLVSVAVKTALQSEEGEVKEHEQQITVSVDAGTRIEGNGNVVVFDGRKDRNSIGDEKQKLSGCKRMVGSETVGRKRRADSVNSGGGKGKLYMVMGPGIGLAMVGQSGFSKFMNGSLLGWELTWAEEIRHG
ncbi:MAG: hypothetical protein Q9169_003431 [Polycauliona sp. 2 TL-2023]